jgi:hypothetical protein
LTDTRPLFVIAALTVAIGAVILLRGQPFEALAAVAVTLVAAGLAGAAAYRVIAPLTGSADYAPTLIAGRTRAALERDKSLTLRAIKDLEFDRAMGKVSEPDFEEMRDRLRARAVRLLKQLDGTGLYRPLIARDVAVRLEAAPAAEAPLTPACLECGAAIDHEARFCKMCGRPVAGAGPS